MYTSVRQNLPRDAGRHLALRRRVSGTVIALGLTSMFTDISSEMVSSILALYFVFYLGLSPFAFGFLDGVYQGASAIANVASGLAADRWRNHKTIAVAGYGLSSICKLALPAVGGAWGAVTGVLVVDRTGKGIRTAPRDAMIGLSSPSETLGTAFGVHRALDTLGALIGPIVAFAILNATATSFDSVFVVSFAASLIGLAILVFFVRQPDAAPTRRDRPEIASSRPTLRDMLATLALPGFRPLVAAAGLLAVMTISDAFVYLILQRGLDLRVGVFPLLYVATSLVYFVLAVPAGWLADRVGRGRVFIAGYLPLLAIYLLLLLTGVSTASATACIVLLGMYYAATDGVLMARASALLPGRTRAGGLGLVSMTTGVARFFGSIMVGALWTWRSSDAALVVLIAGLVVALLFAILTMQDRREPRSA